MRGCQVGFEPQELLASQNVYKLMNAVVLVASVALGQAQTAPDLQYMQAARYIAGSPADPEAIGGYGTSDNLPYSFFQQGNGLRATVEQGKGGVTVRLGNAGPTEVWLRAADSNLTAYLEAKDESGAWRPIEWHHQITCGNSWHRVLLPAQHAWTFSVGLPSGGLRTQLRWHFKSAELEIVSNVMSFSLPLTRFQLEPSLGKEWMLSTQSGMPTLVFERG